MTSFTVSSHIHVSLIITVMAMEKRLFFKYHASKHAAQAPLCGSF